MHFKAKPFDTNVWASFPRDLNQNKIYELFTDYDVGVKADTSLAFAALSFLSELLPKEFLSSTVHFNVLFKIGE